eukprot:1983150-Pleurochrysis_carterae.AAC.1
MYDLLEAVPDSWVCARQLFLHGRRQLVLHGASRMCARRKQQKCLIVKELLFDHSTHSTVAQHLTWSNGPQAAPRLRARHRLRGQAARSQR